MRRFGGEREDLKSAPIESHEILVEQAIPCVEVVVERQLEDGTDTVVVVEAQAMAVGGQDQDAEVLDRARLLFQPLARELYGDGTSLSLCFFDPIRKLPPFINRMLTICAKAALPERMDALQSRLESDRA